MTDYFEQFWAAYPNRKGKKAAEKAYDKACQGEDKAEFSKMVLLAIEAQKRYRNEAQGSGEFIPPWKMPATWLNSGCWDDEVKSHADLKHRTQLALCDEPGCTYPVHGPKFSKCTDHEGRKRGVLLSNELNESYKKHKDQPQGSARQALMQLTNTMRRGR